MPQKIELYSPTYFAACAVGGVVSCGLTHGLMTPLDLVKCNAQTNPKVFPGAIAGLKVIYSGQASHLGFGSGMAGLAKGWAPTFVGYGVQGACKFGFYEYFKHLFGSFFSKEDQSRFKDLIWGSASASAEIIADIGLCPFEAVKVRVQTSPEFARGMADGIPKMIAEGGFGTLYAGLVPLWARQVPYTVIKFVAFERIAEMIYSMLPKKKEDMSKTEQMGVVFGAGYLAGILCGVVSHPADTMVSKINKMKSSGSVGDKMKLIYNGTPAVGVEGQAGFQPAVKGIGFSGLWAGLGPRVVMIGTLTGLQWFVYGAFKTAVGLPAPGGK